MMENREVAVRYYSRGGNTKKLAEAIAEAVGVETLTTDTPLEEDNEADCLAAAAFAKKKVK